MNCSGIFQGSGFDCSNPLFVGLEQRFLIANKGDFDVTYATPTGSERVISGITNKSGKQFWEFTGVNESHNATQELVRGTVSNGYRHILDLSVFEVDSLQKSNLESMAYKRLTAIVIQPESLSFGDGAITVYGLDAGLDLVTLSRILNDVETGGSYRLQLATPEAGSNEPNLPVSFFTSDYATTLAAVEALLTPGA
jgi:hypothetical protein